MTVTSTSSAGTTARSLIPDTGEGLSTVLASTDSDAKQRSVALGDLDADGDLDIVVATTVKRTRSIEKLRWGFRAESWWSFASGSRTQSVALADLDGDGDLDCCGNSAEGYLLESAIHLGLEASWFSRESMDENTT